MIIMIMFVLSLRIDHHHYQQANKRKDKCQMETIFPPVRHTVEERPESCVAATVVVHLEVLLRQSHGDHLLLLLLLLTMMVMMILMIIIIAKSIADHLEAIIDVDVDVDVDVDDDDNDYDDNDYDDNDYDDNNNGDDDNA